MRKERQSRAERIVRMIGGKTAARMLHEMLARVHTLAELRSWPSVAQQLDNLVAGFTRKRPLVSVIIIFLNGEKFIREAIESVFAQTYDNWELLLVDDGSTDASTETARRYAQQYPGKVRYLEHDGHQNRGMSATRNLGIRHANGEYIAFLDADDMWLPHKLKRQVAILESQPQAEMVYGATRYWYGWTGRPEDRQRDYIPDLGVRPDTLFEPPTLVTLLYPLGQATAPCPSDLLMRREMIERIGGFEEDFRGMYQLYEDQAFLAKVFLQEAVFVSSECWDWYRIHPDSCMSVVTRAGQYQSVRLFFLNWLEGFLSEQGLKDTPVWRALQEALWPYHQPMPSDELERGKASFGGPSDNGQPLADERLSVVKQQTKHAAALEGVQWGTLRRVTPISRNWGLDRGLPIDRYYIENFLARHAEDIRGRVLEIGDNSYTCKFGGDRVTRSDVLHVVEGNHRATIVADLTSADHIPSDTFDCIILTQTLQFIYDVQAAIKTIYRILKPGGVILATFPGISQTYDPEWGDSWFWNFTTQSVRRLFEEAFSAANVRIQTHGNVLAAISFLHGMAVEELTRQELDHHEPGYDVTITVRAMKPQATHGWWRIRR